MSTPLNLNQLKLLDTFEGQPHVEDITVVHSGGD